MAHLALIGCWLADKDSWRGRNRASCVPFRPVWLALVPLLRFRLFTYLSTDAIHGFHHHLLPPLLLLLTVDELRSWRLPLLRFVRLRLRLRWRLLLLLLVLAVPVVMLLPTGPPP
jgi:hypothetical protein